MRQIKYRAVGQCLRLEEAWRPVAGTVGRYQAAFSLDESWDGLTCTAVFRGPKATVEQLLVNGACVVPWEALQVRGWLEVGLYGVCGSDRLPTLWAEPIAISDGPTPADAAQEPTPDKWQEYVSRVEDSAAEARTAQDAAAAARLAAEMARDTAAAASSRSEAARDEALSAKKAAERAETSAEAAAKKFSDNVDQLFTSVSNGKAQVASAITDKGIATAEDAAFATMAENIRNIPIPKNCGRITYNGHELTVF